MGGVPQKNEPRQPNTPARVYHQAPRTDSVGGPDSQPPLHCGRVAQAQDRLVRRHRCFLSSTRERTAVALTNSVFPLKERTQLSFLLSSRYKNNVLIDAKAHPEKYTAESTYNMHSLEIKK